MRIHIWKNAIKQMVSTQRLISRIIMNIICTNIAIYSMCSCTHKTLQSRSCKL